MHSHGRLLAERCGVSRRSVVRWRNEGIPVWQADRIAARLCVHPCEIWADWF